MHVAADHLVARIPGVAQVGVVHVSDGAVEVGNLDALGALLDRHRELAQLVDGGLGPQPRRLGIVHQVERGDAGLPLLRQFVALQRRQFLLGALAVADVEREGHARDGHPARIAQHGQIEQHREAAAIPALVLGLEGGVAAFADGRQPRGHAGARVFRIHIEERPTDHFVLGVTALARKRRIHRHEGVAARVGDRDAHFGPSEGFAPDLQALLRSLEFGNGRGNPVPHGFNLDDLDRRAGLAFARRPQQGHLPADATTGQHSARHPQGDGQQDRRGKEQCGVAPAGRVDGARNLDRHRPVRARQRGDEAVIAIDVAGGFETRRGSPREVGTGAVAQRGGPALGQRKLRDPILEQTELERGQQQPWWPALANHRHDDRHQRQFRHRPDDDIADLRLAGLQRPLRRTAAR